MPNGSGGESSRKRRKDQEVTSLHVPLSYRRVVCKNKTALDLVR